MVRLISRRAGVARRVDFLAQWSTDWEPEQEGGDLGDAAELALVIEMRDRQVGQRMLRARVLTEHGEHVHVRARLHLMRPELELVLLTEQQQLDDRLAVLRHCRPGTDQRFSDLYAQTQQQRAVVADRLQTGVIEVDVALGRPPRRGADWSLSDLPSSVIDDVCRAWAAMRRDLVGAVDHLVASDLVRLVASSGDVADVVLVVHDDESVARVRAFAAEVRRIEVMARRSGERLRSQALRSAHAQPRTWLAQNQLRSRQARDALDTVRAVHAALAEVRALDTSAEPDVRDR